MRAGSWLKQAAPAEAEQKPPPTKPDLNVRQQVGPSPSAASRRSPSVEATTLPARSGSSLQTTRSGTSLQTSLKQSTQLTESGNSKAIEARQLQSEVPLQQLHEQMKSLRREVSQISRNVRSVVHDELQDSMQSFNTELARMSRNFRSCIRSELDSFSRQSVDNAVDSNPKEASASPIAFNFKPVRLPGNFRADLEPEQNLTSDGDVAGLVSKNDVKSGCVSMLALAEPLLAQDATVEEVSLKESSQEAVTPSSQQSGAVTNGILKRARHSVMNLDGHAERMFIKKALEDAHSENTYDVEKFYNTTGIWQAMARQDSWFSTISLVVVTANVLWIGIDEDINHADVLINAPWESIVVNNLFCTFFTFEAIMKFLAFKKKLDAFRDSMFLFDLVLVGFMIWETWIEVLLYVCDFFDFKGSANNGTSLFRVFRLFRLTRVQGIVRLSVSVPEFMILLRGMGAAMRSVTVVLIFLFFCIFIFGILFVELLKDQDPFTDKFGDVRTAMYTLLVTVLCGVDVDFMDSMLRVGIFYYVVYLIFIFAATLTLLNVLVGVLCDVISNTSSQAKEDLLADKLEFEIQKITTSLDADGSGTICKEEFDELLTDKSVLRSLDHAGVDVVAFGGLSQFIFTEERDLTCSELCHLISEFRGSKIATVKDLVNTHKFMTMELDNLMAEVRRLAKRTTDTDS